MKLFTLILGISFTACSFGQIDAIVSGTIFNTKSDSIYLAKFDGKKYTDFKASKLDKNGNFKLKTELPAPDYYVLHFGNSRLNLVIRDKDNIKVYGDGSNILQFANIVDSEDSKKLNEYLRLSSNWANERNQLRAQLQKSPNDETLLQRMRVGENNFKSEHKRFIASNNGSPALYATLNDIDFNKEYATYKTIVDQLKASFGKSPSIQNLSEHFATMNKQREAQQLISPGKMAPDFEEMKIDGTMMKLSDLRGKVVLLDFWASWCGPCRRENPNVVKAYKKFKDDGFTVMSVSLDKDKDRWIGAIKKDNLIWPNHVSDLKGWASAAGRKYGVRGIPFTVLIGRDGKIIDLNLRGPALEAKLAELFEK